MAKRRYGIDEAKIQRYIKEGRGQGQGNAYKPWLDIHDFPSMGRVSRCKGWKTNRVHQFMSDNETRYFYILDWSENVIDIREQYPLLDRECTMRIAEEKGIRYPVDTGSVTPIVLTSDFMITIQENGKKYDIARTIKPATDLDKPRVLEKLEIERCYWTERGIDWGIVTDQEINKELALNIEWVHSSYMLEDGNDIDAMSMQAYLPLLKDKLLSSQETIQEVLKSMDSDYNVEPGLNLYLFKHLIATKQLIVANMNKKINVNRYTTEILQMI